MKLSKTTLELLKNFATINTNLLVKSGSSLSTVSASKSILAKGTIEESFPQEFAIYAIIALHVHDIGEQEAEEEQVRQYEQFEGQLAEDDIPF